MSRHFIFALLFVGAVHAEVYRCPVGGQVIYSDQPCTPDAKPESLPPLIVVKPGSLEFEETPTLKEAPKPAKKPDKANAEWLKQHQAKKTKEERVRKGRVEGRVVEGMTAAQVRDLLGEPDRISREQGAGLSKETWTYTTADGHQTIALRNGEVHSVKQNSRKKKTK